jgi:hypothetical protein
MSELQDFELEPSESPERRKRMIWPWVAVLGLLAVGLGVYFGYVRRPAAQPPVAEEEPAQAAQQPAGAAEVEEDLELELPPLAESDPFLRQLLTSVSNHPELARWLAPEDLVRRFTVVVDNFAEGKSPRTHLQGLGPEEPFSAVESGGTHRIDPASYDRYDRFVRLVDSLDSQQLARIYSGIRPLLREAYRDLGYPERDFEVTLARALKRVVETPEVEGDVQLVPGVKSYELADPRLESLSPAQKHLLRMGPENLRILKRKVRQVAEALGLSL